MENLPAPIGAGVYNVYTGAVRTGAVHTGAAHTGVVNGNDIPAAARLGLEPPRFCAECGRRMMVQVRPDGWWAQCSRHGRVDSTELEAHR